MLISPTTIPDTTIDINRIVLVEYFKIIFLSSPSRNFFTCSICSYLRSPFGRMKEKPIAITTSTKTSNQIRISKMNIALSKYPP